MIFVVTCGMELDDYTLLEMYQLRREVESELREYPETDDPGLYDAWMRYNNPRLNLLAQIGKLIEQNGNLETKRRGE